MKSPKSKAGVTILAVVVGLVLAACQPAPATPIAFDSAELAFEGSRAFEIEEQFVRRFPDRDGGQPNGHLSAVWVSEFLTDLGFTCQLDEWTVINYSRPMPLVNSVCRLPGESTQEIVLVAHRDQAPMTIEGAEDNASGIAIMLHLAEALSAERPLPYGLVVASLDGEEYGMLGSRRLMETHPDVSQIVAGISLDSLGRPYYRRMNLDMTGQFKNYGPIWLALLARQASLDADRTWPVALRSPLDQAIDQAAPFSFTDQGPMVAAGVPALNFAGGLDSQDQPLHYRLWHSPEDTLAHQSPAALEKAGRTAESLLRQLMTMQRFPQEAGPYLYLDSRTQVLRGAPLLALFTGFVAIFFIASLVAGRSAFHPSTPNWRLAFPQFLGLWLPWLAGVLLLYAFVEVGLMDEYHLYPATSKDPAIYNPRWTAIGLFLLGLVIFFLLVRRALGRVLEGNSTPTVASRRSFAYLVIGLAGMYTLATNPFSLLFYVPLVPWLVMGGRKGPGRLLDLLLFAVGGLAIYFMVYQFGFVVYDYGLTFLWFMLMMFASGMINFPTLAVASAIIAAGLVIILQPARPREPRRPSTARL